MIRKVEKNWTALNAREVYIFNGILQNQPGHVLYLKIDLDLEQGHRINIDDIVSNGKIKASSKNLEVKHRHIIKSKLDTP